MNATVMAVGFAGLAAWAAARLALSPAPEPLGLPAERRRREALRRASIIYRNCERLIQTLGGVFRRWAGETVGRVRKALDALGETDWRPEEYLAVRTLRLIPACLAAGVAGGYQWGPSNGIAVAVLCLLAAPLWVARQARDRADDRVREIRARLPHTLDLMALILEANAATLFDCLVFAAEENAGNPLGEELQRAVHGIAQGSPPPVVLADISRRLADPDVAEANLAIATSESEGLPLKESLRTLAVRLRVRQIQWLERESERAKVRIVGPAGVVMIACLALVAAPFVLGWATSRDELNIFF